MIAGDEYGRIILAYESRAEVGERARWLSGEGPFAVIAHCREFSFSLWATKEAAEKAKAHLDQMGCGGGCDPLLRKVVDLDE